MMTRPFSFDNFCPKLKPGRVTPQGRRLIFETLDGQKQIILPIEMADVIILANGQFTMRQIIEKIFKLKSTLHFRTLFKTIHQLRDHGFLENGHLLESYSWWSGGQSNTKKWSLNLPLLRRKTWIQPHPLVFYILSLSISVFSVYNLFDASLDAPYSLFYTFESPLLVFFLFYVTISILNSIQSIYKGLAQATLTGQFFGLHLRISPFGIYFKVHDEPVFLITNRLFLGLYHLSVLLIPTCATYIYTQIPYQIVPSEKVWTLTFIKIIFDLSPFESSLVMQAMRSFLSLGQSDIMTGYLKENSLLSLLNTQGRPSAGKRLHAYFISYALMWTALAVAVSSATLRSLGLFQEMSSSLTLFGWVVSMTVLGLCTTLILRLLKPLILKPISFFLSRIKEFARALKKSQWTDENLIEAMSQLPLFSSFSPPLIVKILDHSQIGKLQSGARLITQGEPGKDIFILLDGSLLVERTSFDLGRVSLGTLRPVTIFGEMAIVDDGERTADVTARELSTVIKIPVEFLKKAAKESQYVREIEAFRNAITVNQFFTSAPMFKDLPEDVIHDITMRSGLRYCENQEMIVRQGALGRSFFMILRGAVDVVINKEVIKTIRQGGFFGEISLIADIPRTASVVARENTVVLEMAAANFWEILCQNIELAMFIEAVGENRLSEDLADGSLGTKVGKVS